MSNQDKANAFKMAYGNKGEYKTRYTEIDVAHKTLLKVKDELAQFKAWLNALEITAEELTSRQITSLTLSLILEKEGINSNKSYWQACNKTIHF
jgi:hypothetical protein